MLKEVHDGVKLLGNELALCPVSDLEEDLASAAEPARVPNPDAVVGQRFRQAMGGFHEEMKVRAAALDAEQEETKGLLRKLAAFFALVLILQIGPHLAQRGEKPRSRKSAQSIALEQVRVGESKGKTIVEAKSEGSGADAEGNKPAQRAQS